MKGVNQRTGSMLMEFVISMPILVMLIMLVIQFAQIWTVRQCVAYSAFCAARSLLSANPVEWSTLRAKKERCDHAAARRVLSWVTMLGTRSSDRLRSFETADSSVESAYDKSKFQFVTLIRGDLGTHDVMVPGWGQVNESNSIDMRLNVESWPRDGLDYQGYAKSTVSFKFPLLIPIAGQMVSWLAKHRAEDSDFIKKNMELTGWTGEEETFDGFPYIELKETCVLPLPYSPARLPLNAYDYTAYD